jgi:hypothetical protein
MNYPKFIDVSDYQPVLTAADLKGHINALACKACEVDDQAWGVGDSVDKFCDPKLADNVELAYLLNIPCACYIFDNPNYTSVNGGSWQDHKLHPNSGDPRMLALRQALKNKTYHAICIDVERWWVRYNEYYSNPGTALRIPPLWIRDSAADLMQRIKEDQAAGILRQVPIWIYTAKWVVDAYSPELDTFLANQIQWLADYTTPVYTGSKGKVMTWEALSTLIDAQSFNPKWVGNKRAEMLQLTDAVTVPGIYNTAGAARPVDIDVSLVELAKVFAPGEWSGVTPPPPPVVPPVVPPVDLAPIIARLAEAEARVKALEDWKARVQA